MKKTFFSSYFLCCLFALCRFWLFALLSVLTACGCSSCTVIWQQINRLPSVAFGETLMKKGTVWVGIHWQVTFNVTRILWHFCLIDAWFLSSQCDWTPVRSVVGRYWWFTSGKGEIHWGLRVMASDIKGTQIWGIENGVLGGGDNVARREW